MQDKATRPRATRTVKIGDDHHRLLRILSGFLNLTMQETFEVAVEQTLNAYLSGEHVDDRPLRGWGRECNGRVHGGGSLEGELSTTDQGATSVAGAAILTSEQC